MIRIHAVIETLAGQFKAWISVITSVFECASGSVANLAEAVHFVRVQFVEKGDHECIIRGSEFELCATVGVAVGAVSNMLFRHADNAPIIRY